MAQERCYHYVCKHKNPFDFDTHIQDILKNSDRAVTTIMSVNRGIPFILLRISFSFRTEWCWYYSTYMGNGASSGENVAKAILVRVYKTSPSQQCHLTGGGTLFSDAAHMRRSSIYHPKHTFQGVCSRNPDLRLYALLLRRIKYVYIHCKKSTNYTNRQLVVLLSGVVQPVRTNCPRKGEKG